MSALAVARVFTPFALLAAFAVAAPSLDDVSPYLAVLVGLGVLEVAFIASAFPRAALLAVVAGRAPREACATVARRARDIAAWAQGTSRWGTPTMFTLAVIVLEDVDLATARRRSATVYRARWGEEPVRGRAPRGLAIGGVLTAAALGAIPGTVGHVLGTVVLVGVSAAATLARALLTVGAYGHDVGLTDAELEQLLQTRSSATSRSGSNRPRRTR